MKEISINSSTEIYDQASTEPSLVLICHYQNSKLFSTKLCYKVYYFESHFK